MAKSKLLFVALTSIIAGLLIAIGAMAWTSPSGNPPSGTGAAVYYSNSKVGIGTSTPAYPLNIFGSSDSLFGLSRSGATSSAIFKLGTDGALIINAGALDAITVKSGNVGIGTTSPTAKLVVSGQLSMANNEIINVSGPTASSSVATKGYVDAAAGSTTYYVAQCGTTAVQNRVCNGSPGTCPTGWTLDQQWTQTFSDTGGTYYGLCCSLCRK